MEYYDFWRFVINNGVALFVAAFLLVRTEKAIKSLDRSIGLLSIIVAKIGGLNLDDVRRDYRNGNGGK